MRRGWLSGLGLLLAVGCHERESATATRSAQATTSVTVVHPKAAPALPSAPAPSGAALRSATTERPKDTSPSDRAAPASPLAYERLTLGAAEDASLPWIVALHGLGDTPRGFAPLFSGLPLRAHVYLIQAPIAYGSGFDWLGERVSGDPERLALAIARRVEDLGQLLDQLAAQPQNRGDAVVTGFSQGGVLSYAVAVAGLPHVAATAPLAGWLPPSLAATLPSLPVYAYHGREDRVVGFGATQLMIAAWSDHRQVLEFHAYPGLAHSISADMRRDWAETLGRLVRQSEAPRLLRRSDRNED